MKLSEIIIKEIEVRLASLKILLNQDQNLEDSIFLEAKQQGNYSYPDLLVSMHRLSLDEDVQKAASKLNLNITNTAQEQDGHQYIGDMNHEQAINLVKESGLIPINLRLFADFLKEIKHGLDGKKVYGGRGNIIPRDRLLTAWNEITEVRNPWRAEWFDNKFIQEGNQLYNIYYKINPNGTLELVKEPLEDYLMEDKFPRINLGDWLERANNQGLPPQNVKSGGLYYWYPKNGSVARFNADSVMAYLDCCRDPWNSSASLGVRPAKIKG